MVSKQIKISKLKQKIWDKDSFNLPINSIGKHRKYDSLKYDRPRLGVSLVQEFGETLYTQDSKTTANEYSHQGLLYILIHTALLSCYAIILFTCLSISLDGPGF